LSSAPSQTSSSTSNRPSHFLLVLALGVMFLLWSFNYLAGKIALRHLPPFTLAVFRIDLAALVILPFYIFRRGRTPVQARDLWTLSYLGVFLIINQVFFTVGLGYTTSGHSSMILATGPIIVLLFARALKLEALTPGKILGMVIAFTGVAILATEQGLNLRHSATLAGDLLTLVGTTSFSVYAVLGKKFARQFDSITMNTFNLLAGALLLLPLSIRQAAHLDWGSVGWAGWAGLVYMAAISSVAAYTLFYWVLRYMDASRVAAVNYLQPLGAILVAAAFLGELPTRNLMLGGALILLGVYLAERGGG
jgi:drug/metabolite transporter (DMT)-like permease